MKVEIAATLGMAAGVSAFVPSSSFVSVSRTMSKSSSSSVSMVEDGPGSWYKSSDPSVSQALPWTKAPLIGDGTLVGDVGFDPLNLSKTVDLGWLRAAELKHGRVCMLATVGFLAPELVQHPVGFQGFDFPAEFTQMNAFAALSEVPRFGLAQIVIACGLAEIASLVGTFNFGDSFAYDDNLSSLERSALNKGNRAYLAGAAKTTKTFNKDDTLAVETKETAAPGDLGFDPLGLAANGVNPDYALAEIKHCRLAMIGFLGMAVQQFINPNGGTLEQFLDWAV